MIEEKEIDCSYMDEIVCPYCGHSDECMDEYTGDETFTSQCSDCDKYYSVHAMAEVHFSSVKIPCKNNEEPHELYNMQSYDKDGKYMIHIWRCRKCEITERRDNPDYKPEQPKC